MVGAVLAKGRNIIGRGWHRRAGLPHAEIEALHDAQKHGFDVKGASMYVTLEPCSTHGRTPPCTEAIIGAGIKRVIVAATDPNPKHAGKGFGILNRAGIRIDRCDKKITSECERLNEAFNHWVVHATPFVTVKAAMTLDGKIATASGESKWITSEQSRKEGMRLRQGADAILVGINTILADDPSLTFRIKGKVPLPSLRRIVLDSSARTPLKSKLASDGFEGLTTIVVGEGAPEKRVAALTRHVNVISAPTLNSQIDLRWLLEKLGEENVTSLLVEGGGEVSASFLLGGFAQRVAFFYAPKILGGRDSRKSVAGDGVASLRQVINLSEIEWRKAGRDLFLTGRVG